MQNNLFLVVCTILSGAANLAYTNLSGEGLCLFGRLVGIRLGPVHGRLGRRGWRDDSVWPVPLGRQLVVVGVLGTPVVSNPRVRRRLVRQRAHWVQLQ